MSPPKAGSQIPPAWIIGIVASAGGIAPVSELLWTLPVGFPAAVLVMMHMQRGRATTELASIFGRYAALPVTEARHGEAVLGGRIYVAAPNFHLTVSRRNTIRLTQTPLVHFVRPSADVLLPSLAVGFGRHAIAVVLTGSGSDGAAGAAAVRNAGGIVIVQDQATSLYGGMPAAAEKAGRANYVLPLNEISQQLMDLTAAA